LSLKGITPLCEEGPTFFFLFEQTGVKETHFGFSGDKLVVNWQLESTTLLTYSL
jgi:hypothetical protein